MGDFVAHATQLDTWPEQMDLVGDVRSMNEVKEVIEKVLGELILILSFCYSYAEVFSREKTADDLCLYGGASV